MVLLVLPIHRNALWYLFDLADQREEKDSCTPANIAIHIDVAITSNCTLRDWYHDVFAQRKHAKVAGEKRAERAMELPIQMR